MKNQQPIASWSP